jgi:hypothetical protein
LSRSALRKRLPQRAIVQRANTADGAEQALPFLHAGKREALLSGNVVHFWPEPNGR